MIKNASIWQRLLAFALVCVMLLGYVPVNAAATEGDGTAAASDPLESFTVKLTCKMTLTEKATESTTESVEGDETAEREFDYTYVYSYSGLPDGAVVEARADYDANFTITYGNKVLKAVAHTPNDYEYKAGTYERTTEAKWTCSVSDSWSVKSGDTISGPALVLGSDEATGVHSSFVEPPTWTITDQNGNDVSGKEAKVAMGTLTASLSGQHTKTTTVGYADATYVIGKAPGWYKEMPTVTVTATTTADSGEIAPLTVDGENVAWGEKGETGYSVTIDGGNATNRTISVNGQSVELKVDNKVPEIGTIVAHEDADGNTKVIFSYEIGGSGAKISATVGGVTETHEVNESETFDHTINGKGTQVAVKITSGTGLTAEATASVTERPEVVISGFATTGETNILKNDGILTFKAENLTIKLVKWIVNDGTVSEEDNKTLTYIVPKDGTPERLAVKFVDEYNRTFTKTVKIAFDDTDPTYAICHDETDITEAVNETKTYKNENQTYTVSFADESGSVNSGVSSSSYAIFYYNENQSQTVYADDNNKAEFTLTDGQHLRSIYVHAEDKAGNVAISDPDSCKPNVVVDTTDPVIKATLTINAGESQLRSLNTTNKYLKYAGNIPEDGITATLRLTQEETNPEVVDWTDTYTVTVTNGNVNSLSFSGVTISDLAGNAASAPIVVEVTDAFGDKQKMSFARDEDGTYSGTITINANAKDESEPTGQLSLTTNSTSVDLDGCNIYQNPTIAMTVSGNNGEKVTAKVKLTDGYNWLTQNSHTFDSTANVTFNIPANTEVKNVDLIAAIQDMETFSFGIDNQAPRVTVAPSITLPDANEGVHYCDEEVTLTFKLEDMLSATATITYTIDDGEARTLVLNDKNKEGTIIIAENTKLTSLTVSASDALNNTITAFSGYTFTPIEVDTINPETKITISGVNGEAIEAKIKDDVAYYDTAVKITAKVTEKNLTSAKLTYSINGADNATVDLTQDAEDPTLYTCEVKIADGEYVTGIQLSATDKAGRTAEDTTSPLVMDTTAPVVTIVTNNPTVKNSTDEKLYYDGEVVFTVTITDNFLDLDNIAVTPAGADFALVERESGQNLWDADTYVATITVDDDEEMTGFAIAAKDFANHGFESDSDKDMYHKVDANGVANYSKKTIVVDTVNPVITAEITANEDVDMKGFLKLEEDGKYYYYVVLNPVEEHGNDSKFHKSKDVTLTLTFTLTEKNPDAVQLEENGWTVDADGIWTWTKAVTVKENNNGLIEVEDLTVVDMAKRIPTETVNVTIKDSDSELDGVLPMESNNGVYNGTIHIDRRTPENENNENDIPSVTIAADRSVAFSNTFKGSSVTYTLNVKDNGSGLDPEVTATAESSAIYNGTGTGAVSATATDLANGSSTVTVSITEGWESNDILLTIVLKDKVGNAYTYVETLGLDDHTPEVSVTFDNNEFQNGKYYKAKRVGTIKVVDINFDPAGENAASITSEGHSEAGTWAAGEITYTYGKDADCKLIVNSITDKAGNTAAATAVQYAENDNHADFVVDMTNPVIKVVYRPGTASGKDGAISHYDQNLTATATITEHNFRAADVKADMPTGYAMTFTDSTADDNHSATTVFKEGNNYNFSIAYTDLAGNPAQTYKSHTFCVDLDAPTIKITRGDLTNKGLNIIQDDLTLGFTINDEEKNLREPTITVTKLDEEFKTVTITGSEFYSVTEQEGRTTYVVNFANIAKEKLNDGLYTVEISAKDYAGNSTTLAPKLIFSLNRYGSTFYTDDPFTQSFLAVGEDGNVYHKTVSDKLVLKEINPNKVWTDGTKKTEGSQLTVIVNGTSTVLTEGKDYELVASKQGSGDSVWYLYTYEIDPAAFVENDDLVDGRYSILIYGEDEAGNKNTNESNVAGKLQKGTAGEYNGKIEFILDNTAPIITTTGIESGKNYNAEAQKMEIFLSDNTPSSIMVYLNGNPVPLAELVEGLAENAEWLVYNEDTNSYTLNVPELNTLFSGQEIRIVVTDAAGNEAELLVNDFSVSTNVFVRLLNSTWFLVSIVLLAILLIVLLVLKQKKRKNIAA